jgi:hypothetical protein
MSAIAFINPILPGKTEQVKRMSQTALTERRAEYEASRRRAGITLERSWIQTTPQGDMGIVYLEVEDPQRAFMVLGSSQEPFDVWFRQIVLETQGLDITQPAPGPLPELIFDWRAK